MELQRGLPIIPFLFKKYACLGMTYHIPLPRAVFALQVHPKTLSSVDMTLCYLRVLVTPSPRKLLWRCVWAIQLVPLWHSAPHSLGSTQMYIYCLCGPTSACCIWVRCLHLCYLLRGSILINVGKTSWSGDLLWWLTPRDSRLGGTCWQAEIRANSSENEIKLVAKHSVTFRPSRNTHLCLMETRWDHLKASRTCRTKSRKSPLLTSLRSDLPTEEWQLDR